MKDPNSDKWPSGSDFPWGDPLNAALNFQRLVQRVAEEVAREVGIPKGPPKDWPFSPPSPSAEVTEDATTVRVILDVPGVEQQDLNITLAANILSIEGERRGPAVEETSQSHRRERPYGPFRKEIKLPCEVLADQVEASMKNGVLTVLLPKKAKPVGVKINVKAD